MFPKFDEVPIRTYLIVLAKIRRPSTIPVARISRSLSSRTMSAASLATSVAVCTEIPTSASCSATASLTPSPRNPTVEPRARWALIDPRLLLRGDAREDRRAGQRGRELRVVELIELGAGERPLDGQADVGADLLRDAVVVAGDDLHLHVEELEAVERLLGVGLRAIDEGEEAREVEVAFIVGVQGRAVRRRCASRRRSRGCRRRTGGRARPALLERRSRSGRAPSRARP